MEKFLKRKRDETEEPVKKKKEDEKEKKEEKKEEKVKTEEKKLEDKVKTEEKKEFKNPKVIISGVYEYDYDPYSISCKNGVSFLQLCQTMNEIQKNSGRLKKIQILCNFFRSVILQCPNDLLPCVNLFSNQLAPTYEGLELGIGDNGLTKAIGESYGLNMKDVKSMIKKYGDLGIVGQSAKSNQRTMFQSKDLTINDVFKAFTWIATTSGKDSQKKKIQKIQNLLVSCKDPLETLYMIRQLQSKLRIGLAEQTILTSLAHAIILTQDKEVIKMTSDSLKNFEEEMKRIYSEVPNYSFVIPRLLSNGFENNGIYLTCGIPVKPMLAKRSTSVKELFEKLTNEFTCEYKYDGERAQIHYFDKKVKIYSRNLENHTEKYPDLCEMIMNFKMEHDFILDGEVVAMKDGQILPFQTLMTRKKKDIQMDQIKVKVCYFAFDLLYFDKSLLRDSLKTRRDILFKSFEKHLSTSFQFSVHFDSKEEDKIQEFLTQSISSSCEGIMIKDLESTYEPSKRSNNWLKLKKDYMDGVGDSMDLVVLGAYHGKGKRTGGYGGFLLFCYDPDSEEYGSCSKIGTGFTEDKLEEFSETLKQYLIDGPRDYYKYEKSVEPDVWFDPEVVWEVKAADLSLSPKHLAAYGKVEEDKGIALRFPRFLRERKDKKPEDSTTVDQLVEMYLGQVNKK